MLFNFETTKVLKDHNCGPSNQLYIDRFRGPQTWPMKPLIYTLAPRTTKYITNSLEPVTNPLGTRD
jgi:hypothetical protein